MKTHNGKIHYSLQRKEWYERKRNHLLLTLDNADVLEIPVHRLREIIAKEQE